MDIWFILGIEQTKDLERIRDAYREKLVQVNPEDDPEGFKELREAYEEANRLARQEDEEKSGFDDTPVGRWMQRVDDTYRDYALRIDGGRWDGLLADDVCFGLDTKEEAEEELLRYLAGHHLLPHVIWKRIEACFDIENREEELAEHFPKDFLEYIINNAKYEDNIDYYLFEEDDPELPYDNFIGTYLRMMGALQERDINRAEHCMEQLEEMPLTHPYQRIQKVRLLISKKEFDEAQALADEVIAAYPDLLPARMMEAELCWSREDYAAAAQWYEKILELAPEHPGARCGIADCRMADGRYAEAKAIYKELLNVNRFDTYVHKCMMDCNEKLIPYYEEKLIENSGDDESRLELSWCMYQNYRFDDAYKLLEGQERTTIYELDFSYLRGRCLLQMERGEEAEKCLWHWTELFPRYEHAEGEPGKRNREREGLVYFFIAEIKIDAELFEDALRVNDRALEHALVDKGMILTQRGTILQKLERFDEAVEKLSEALELEPNNFDAFICRGECMEEMKRFQDALDDYDAAIRSYPYYVKPYIQQTKIFMRFEMYDQAEQVLERFEQFEIESDQVLLYRAKLCREKGNGDEGMKLLSELAEKLADEEHVTDLPEKDKFYHEKALAWYYQSGDDHLQKTCDALDEALLENNLEPRYYYFYGNVLWEMGNLNGALERFEQALKVGGENPNVYFQMAGVYHDRNDEKEEEMLKKVIEIYPEHDEVYGRLGQFYEHYRRYSEAIDAYTKQLERSPSGYYYVARGLLYFQFGKNEKSMEDYQSALELNDNNAYANYNMGRIHLAQGNLEEAELLFEKAIEVAEKPAEIFYRYLAKCYCRMGHLEKAIEVLQKQIGLDINPVNGYYYMGRVYRSAMKGEKALEAFRKGKLLRNSKNRGFDSEIVELYIDVLDADDGKAQRKGKYAGKAEIHLNDMKANDPASDEVRDTYAYFYHETGQYSKEYKLRKQARKYGAADWYHYAQAAAKMQEQQRMHLVKKDEYQEEFKKAMQKAAAQAKANLWDYESRAFNLKLLAAICIDEGELSAAKDFLEELSHTQMCDHCFEKQCYEYYYQLARYELAAGNKAAAVKAVETACQIAPDDKQCRDLAKELKK